MNYYKRHIGDYMKDASHLSLLEHGVYVRLMDVYYTREGSIPEAQAGRLIGVRTKEDKEALATVVAEFFTVVDGHLVQQRCEREIAGMQAKAESNRVVGKRGGRPKKETQTVSENTDSGNPKKTHMVSENNPNETQANSHKPIANNQEEIPSSSEGVGTPRAGRGDDDKPANPAEWIEVFAEQHGVDVDHRSFHDRKKFFPLAAAWTAAGITVGQMRAACAKAHAEATEPIAWLPAYVDRVLASMQTPRTPAPAEGFAEREARQKREAWEATTGRQWPGTEPAEVLAAGPVFPTAPTVERIA